MSFIRSVALLCVVVAALTQVSAGASIEQRLVVVSNTKTVGGAFQVAVQVKGTDLPAANTLGSATIDVQFDNTKLTYVNPTWGIPSGVGYSRTATNNGTYIRVGLLGLSVNESGGGDPPGYDVGTSYATWIQLNFTLKVAEGGTDLTIDPGTNAVDLFENYRNEPATGVILTGAIPLTAPVNIIGEPLPIQLASFSATVAQEGGSVLLKWSTISETDNLGFEVQKAPEGSDAYETIPNSFVAGNGTTMEAHSYSFTDATVAAGVWYYRLKQTDRDGTVHYSEGIRPTGVTGVEDRPLPTEFALDQNYPNPFNPSTRIEFALPRESQVKLEVYNLLGQVVATLVDDVRPAGYYAQRFDAGALGTGIYFYRLTAGENSFLKKMLLVK